MIDVYLAHYQNNEDIVCEILGQDKYRNLLETKREVADNIHKASKNSNREKYLQKIQQIIKPLKEQLTLLENMAPTIQIRIKKDTNNQKRQKLTIIVAIVGILVGIVIGFFF